MRSNSFRELPPMEGIAEVSLFGFTLIVLFLLLMKIIANHLQYLDVPFHPCLLVASSVFVSGEFAYLRLKFRITLFRIRFKTNKSDIMLPF